ncbi:MAG: hypothetical protein ACPG4W_07020 [Flavobacteriales bacterium]
MLNLQTKTLAVNKSPETLKQHLANPQVLASYLPDQVTHTQSDADELSFQIMGGTLLRLKPKFESNTLIYVVDGKIEFQLAFDIRQGATDQQALVTIEAQGQLNPMMEMMVKKPLSQFIDQMLTKVSG